MASFARVTRGAAGLLLVAAGASGTSSTWAQSRAIYSVNVPMEIEHDSNPTMAVAPAGSTTWLRVTPRLTAGYVVDNDHYSLEAALAAEKSSNTAVARDRLDPRLRLGWKHTGERDVTEVAAVLERRALRDLAFREQVPIGVDGSRTLLGIIGSWQRDVDERTQLSADARQEWERFSGTSTPDFRRTTAAVRLTREQDERRSWYVGVNGQLYQPERDSVPLLPGVAAPERSSVVGAVLGIRQALSPRWRIDANVGPVNFNQSTTRTAWQGAVKVDYTGERWSGGVELARAPGVNATFAGLVVTDELRARVRYEVDPRSRVEVDAGHAREKATGSRRSQASVAWVRQLTAAWELAVRASTHRQQGPEGIARSNRIAAMLVYSAPDF